MYEVIADLCAVAEQLAIQHSDELPIDPRALAGEIGIEVQQHFGPSRFAPEADPPIIWVPADMEPDRQRFRIAHELCEALMRAHELDRALTEDTRWGSREDALQAGASALLMPGELFEYEGRASGWDLAYLKTVFHVSWEAALRRVYTCEWATSTMVDALRSAPPKVTLRRCHHEIVCPDNLMDEEREAILTVYDRWPQNANEATTDEASSLRVSLDAQLFYVDAWPALPERNGYRRVCLVTHPHDCW